MSLQNGQHEKCETRSEKCATRSTKQMCNIKKMSEMVRIYIPMVLLTCLGTQGLALIPQ